VNKLLKSKEYPFILANLDGVCKHPTYGACIFEAKTASAFKADEWNDAVPIEYVLQVQHYLAVTGYMGAYIAVLIGGNTFKWEFLERDEELISMLIKRETDFWEHVQLDIPPSLDGSEASAAFIKKRFSEAIPHSEVQLPGAAAALIDQFEDAREKADLYTAEKQKAENRLKQMLGENDTGIAGNRIITWKNVRQERFDSKTFESDHPDLCKKYTSQTSYRRFTVKRAS
jgi:predicted phage-related endonuclease